MNKLIKDRKIILELNEHEALQILTLIRKQISRSDKIWQPYWEDQAQKIQQSIEQAAYLQNSTCSEGLGQQT
jgi:hypothetical protein